MTFDFHEDDEYQQRKLTSYHFTDLFDLDSPELDRYDDKRTDLIDEVEKEIERIELNLINCRDSYLLDDDDGTCNVERLEDEIELLKMELYALEVHLSKEGR